jgi:hypothetical protein
LNPVCVLFHYLGEIMNTWDSPWDVFDNQATNLVIYDKFSKYSAALTPSVCKNILHIPFISNVKNMNNADGSDADKTEWINLEFLMDPGNSASKYSQIFSLFKGGCTEDYFKCFISWCHFVILRAWFPWRKLSIGLGSDLVKWKSLVFFCNII